MASPVARVTDSVICNCSAHGPNKTGTISTGSGTVTADGKAVARLGDTGVLVCGHHFRITSASTVTDADGIKVARVGDSINLPVDLNGTFLGTGTITSGSPTVVTD